MKKGDGSKVGKLILQILTPFRLNVQNEDNNSTDGRLDLNHLHEHPQDLRLFLPEVR